MTCSLRVQWSIVWHIQPPCNLCTVDYRTEHRTTIEESIQDSCEPFGHADPPSGPSPVVLTGPMRSNSSRGICTGIVCQVAESTSGWHPPPIDTGKSFTSAHRRYLVPFNEVLAKRARVSTTRRCVLYRAGSIHMGLCTECS